MGNKEQGGDGRNSTSDEEEEERRRTDGWLQTEASSNLRSKKRPTNRPRPVLYTFAEFPPHLHPSFTSTCASLFLCFFVTAYRTDRTSPPPSLAFFTVCVLRRSGHPPVPRSSSCWYVLYPRRRTMGLHCIFASGIGESWPLEAYGGVCRVRTVRKSKTDCYYSLDTFWLRWIYANAIRFRSEATSPSIRTT